MIRFGYKASAEQFGPVELRDYAVLAEHAGFDSVVISDHLQPWRHTGGHAPFSFAWLGAVGERTERVMLGTSVVSPIHRYHPGVVAQAMATLGVLDPGRMMLGVGTGEAMNEVPLGVRWPEQKERFQMLKEAVLLMKMLWTEDRVTFEGNHFRTENATIYDKPSTPIPLYVAASGPAAARLAGRYADGFITTSGKGLELYRDKLLPAVQEGAELYETLLEKVREGAAEADRDAEAIAHMIEIKVSYDTDAERAEHDCGWWAALALSGDEKAGVDDPIEMERLADANRERASSRFIVSADPAEVAARVGDYLDLGFTELNFHFPGDDQRRALDLFARDVLPLLRERVRAR